MKTMKIIATLLILAVVISGISTINASEYSDAREADARANDYIIIGDINATKPSDGTYEITLKLDQKYDLEGSLRFAALNCSDSIQSGIKLAPDQPATGFKTFKTGTWKVYVGGEESCNYIINIK